VFKQLGKSVNNLGSCPSNPDGALRAGLSVRDRRELRNRFRHSTTTDIFAAHKFAIVFENRLIEGYVTEKIINAYLGKAVPVYW